MPAWKAPPATSAPTLRPASSLASASRWAQQSSSESSPSSWPRSATCSSRRTDQCPVPRPPAGRPVALMGAATGPWSGAEHCSQCSTWAGRTCAVSVTVTPLTDRGVRITEWRRFVFGSRYYPLRPVKRCERVAVAGVSRHQGGRTVRAWRVRRDLRVDVGALAASEWDRGHCGACVPLHAGPMADQVWLRRLAAPGPSEGRSATRSNYHPRPKDKTKGWPPAFLEGSQLASQGARAGHRGHRARAQLVLDDLSLGVRAGADRGARSC
jgi:hypothetical protein